MGKVVGPLRTNGDFEPFDGVHHQQAQFTVEDVKTQYFVEAGVGSEGV